MVNFAQCLTEETVLLQNRVYDNNRHANNNSANNDNHVMILTIILMIMIMIMIMIIIIVMMHDNNNRGHCPVFKLEPIYGRLLVISIRADSRSRVSDPISSNSLLA